MSQRACLFKFFLCAYNYYNSSMHFKTANRLKMFKELCMQWLVSAPQSTAYAICMLHAAGLCNSTMYIFNFFNAKNKPNIVSKSILQFVIHQFTLIPEVAWRWGQRANSNSKFQLKVFFSVRCIYKVSKVSICEMK